MDQGVERFRKIINWKPKPVDSQAVQPPVTAPTVEKILPTPEEPAIQTEGATTEPPAEEKPYVNGNMADLLARVALAQRARLAAKTQPVSTVAEDKRVISETHTAGLKTKKMRGK